MAENIPDFQEDFDWHIALLKQRFLDLILNKPVFRINIEEKIQISAAEFKNNENATTCKFYV